MRKPELVKSLMYHIFNRGITKRKIFYKDEDYRFFIYKIGIFKRKYHIEIMAYCIMPNHFHLFLYTQENGINISKFMKSLQLSYALYFNHRYNNSGHVFQGKYVSKQIDLKDMPRVLKYIKLNPVKDKLVNNFAEWRYRG